MTKVTEAEQAALHRDILYPVVRVRTAKSGGSGTLIACIPDPRNEGESMSFVLTNAHVIDDAVTTHEDWDSLLKKEVVKEFLDPVVVELFSYKYLSSVNSADSYKAKIIAYDHHHDIAVLRLESPKVCSHVAKLYPKGKERDIKLFTDVYTVGCSVGHDPLASKGQVTYMNELVENELFWMSSSNVIFGNSGGATYLADSHEFIGIPARVRVLQLGFGLDVLAFMGMFIPIPRIYDFLDEQELKFLYDPTAPDYYQSMEIRQRKQRESMMMSQPQVGGP